MDLLVYHAVDLEVLAKQIFYHWPPNRCPLRHLFPRGRATCFGFEVRWLRVATTHRSSGSPFSVEIIKAISSMLIP